MSNSPSKIIWYILLIVALVTLLSVKLYNKRLTSASDRDVKTADILSQSANTSFSLTKLFHRINDNTNVKNSNNKILLPCEESSIWCRVEMPKKSLFRFSSPIDPYRWRVAQRQAARGEQVLLKKIIKQFPFYLDFIDGDISFRKMHNWADIFADSANKDFSPLVGPFSGSYKQLKESPTWSKQGGEIPPNYNFRKRKRAAIIKLGYGAFVKSSEYFTGAAKGEGYFERNHLIHYFNKIKTQTIDTPFILLHSSNENWGIFSHFIENRTANWGKCCTPSEVSSLSSLLDHPQTLMFLANQHHNLSHPKLLTLPRGLPIYAQSKSGAIMKKIIWDTMRNLANNNNSNNKNQFVFSATSKAFHRTQIMNCIKTRFQPSDFETISYGEKLQNRLDPESYYRKLGQAMIGLAMPGVGYDTFRLWETMTMGTVAVLERGVGFDKTLWRLPALLVDDFSDVTPELLRTAYVEALYRHFWHSLVGEVASSMSSKPLFDRFPPESEEPDFMRPAVPFSCGSDHSGCGKGTKKFPIQTC